MNKKILYIFTVSLLMLGCSDAVENSGTYLESAKSYYESGDYKKAQLELKNALQMDANLAEAYYYLALIDEKERNWGGMIGKLSTTVELDPVNQDARLKLAKLYLLYGKLELAKTHMDVLLKDDPKNLDGMALLAAVYLKQDDKSAALSEAEKVLAVNPEHVDAVSIQVAVYMAQQDFSTAEKKLDKVLISKPNELTFNLLKLQIHIKSKDIPAIEKDYLNLIEHFPLKHEFSYALAKLYVGTSRDEMALKLLKSVVEKNADQVKPKLVLVDYFLQKDRVEAEKIISKFIAEKVDSPDLYMRLATLYIQQKKFTEAKVPLNWIIERNEKEKLGLNAKVLLAKIAIQEQDNTKALTLVEQVLTVDDSHYLALLLKARIKVIDGIYNEAIPELQVIISKHPNSDEALVLLAQTYIKKNSPVLADANFRQALKLNPGNFSAVMPVVVGMIKSKEIDQAEGILEKALKTKPGHMGALQTLAQIRLLNKDWPATQELADLIAKKSQGVGFSSYLEGKIAQGKGLYNDAIEKYKLALTVTPTLSGALKNIFLCYEALKQRDGAIVYLDKFIQDNPTNSYPVILKAQLYSFAKDWDKALLILNKGAEQWPNNAAFYEAITRIYRNKNEKEKVVGVYEKGLKKSPENIRLRMLLASAYEENENYENAVKQYEILISKKPDIDLVVNNLVSLLLDHFPGKESAERALKLAKRFENSKQPYFKDTYGWALLHNGNFGEAVTVFKQVVSRMPNVAVFKYHLGVVYSKLNLNEQAISLLEQALEFGAKENQFLEKDLALQLINEVNAKTDLEKSK